MTNKEYSSPLTVVVPVYNEEKNLKLTAPAIVTFCKIKGWQVIFVNDGSIDQSKKILESLNPSTELLIANHKVNRGYGGALKTGIQLVKTPYLVTIDADGQHILDDIERIFQYAIENEADMVVGKRDTNSSADFYRTLGKLLIRTFTKILLPLPITDLNSGFKLYRTDLAKKYIQVCPDSMAFSDVITLVFISERNLVLEQPIKISPRIDGQSTINTFTAFETVIQVLNISLMFNPLRVFLPISLLSILAGLGWGVPIVLLGRGVSVGAMLAIVTGLIFFVLGLLASQLSAIRMERLRDTDDKG